MYFCTTILFLVALACATPIKRSAPNFVFDGDAPFSLDADTLASVLTCPNGTPSPSSPPVLLVHGTFSDGVETWEEGYVPALLANGFTACYLTLPGRAMGDMQVTAEYVAYNLHYLSTLSGGLKTAVLSHSQGGPDTQWALEFWPSTREVTSSFVALAPDFTGISLLDSEIHKICTAIECQAALWQQLKGSNFGKALQSHNFGALVPTTTIWSQFDELVRPSYDNANLPSATVVSIQDFCPARVVDHVFIVIDAAAFAIALDALQNNGAASLSRVRSRSWLSCLEVVASDMQISVANQLTALLDAAVDGVVLGQPRVSSEPPLMTYAI